MFYTDRSLKEVCEEIEEVLSLEDEKFSRELDEALGLNHADTCLCGNPECGGREWLFEDDDPFAVI